jgi:hypothetical protein
MKRPFDELVEESSVGGGEETILNDKYGRQADGHALTRV